MDSQMLVVLALLIAFPIFCVPVIFIHRYLLNRFVKQYKAVYELNYRVYAVRMENNILLIKPRPYYTIILVPLMVPLAVLIALAGFVMQGPYHWGMLLAGLFCAGLGIGTPAYLWLFTPTITINPYSATLEYKYRKTLQRFDFSEFAGLQEYHGTTQYGPKISVHAVLNNNSTIPLGEISGFKFLERARAYEKALFDVFTSDKANRKVATFPRQLLPIREKPNSLE